MLTTSLEAKRTVVAAFEDFVAGVRMMPNPVSNEPGAKEDPLDDLVLASLARPTPRRWKFSHNQGDRPLSGYTIQRGVGVGGFGEVYFALSDGGKEVALKRIQRNLEIELRGISHCLNLKHSNLVDIYDIRYDDQGGAWVIMEFMAGPSLKETIDRHPQGLPLEEVRKWMSGLLSGLAYLHDQGIVHRDVKPGNIFLDHGVVKIGDYGLSKHISASRMSGQTESVGTFHYMAPEIGKGSYGKQIDIYATGVILYEMLTGQVPFDGESAQEIIMRHLTDQPRVDNIPLPFRDIVLQAMHKDPARRYASAHDMQTAITAAFNAANARGNQTAVPVAVQPQLAAIDMNHAIHNTRDPGGKPWNQCATARWTISNKTNRTPSGPASMAKVGLVLLAISVFAPPAVWLFPVALVLLLLSVVVEATNSLRNRTTASVTSAPTVATLPVRFRSWQELAREQLDQKTWSVRAGEWTGSALFSALITPLSTFALALAFGKFEPNIPTVAVLAWLTITSLISAWGIMFLGKFCEGRETDAVRRRIAYLSFGLATGLLSFALAEFLLIDFRVDTDLVARAPSFYTEHGDARLPLFLLFMGGLWLLPRWWKQTDPLRKQRFQVWSVGAALLAVFLTQLAWRIPSAWWLIAVNTSLAVQLSSSWLAVSEREAARREFYRTA